MISFEHSSDEVHYIILIVCAGNIHSLFLQHKNGRPNAKRNQLCSKNVNKLIIWLNQPVVTKRGLPGVNSLHTMITWYGISWKFKLAAMVVFITNVSADIPQNNWVKKLANVANVRSGKE